MKAVYAEENFKIGLRDIPVPEIRPDEVLIRMAYTGICGSDLHAYRGMHAFRKPPVMLGHEIAGEVVKTGAAVRRTKPGEHVTVMPQIGCGCCAHCKSGRVNLCGNKILPGTAGWGGTFGEYFAAPESAVCGLKGVPDKLGALTEPLAVANHVMKRAALHPSGDLVILGSGTLGLMTLAIAPSYGFTRVLVTDITDYNLEQARALGAVRTVNVARQDLEQRVKETFGEEGVSNVVIAAGGPQILEQALSITGRGGMITYFAMITSPMTLNTYPIVFKELQVQGSMNYTMEDFEDAVRLLKEKPECFERLITHVFPLEEAGKAFEILDQRKEPAVKILLRSE